jgi:[acyl-carrier-protein] S-malonyltransferase
MLSAMMNATEPAADRTALLAFPGIGMEPSGHEAAFVQRHADIVMPYLAAGSSVAGIPLADRLQGDAFLTLDERCRQILIFCLSAAMADVLDRNDIRPVGLAGFSFGIYAALHAAGALSFPQALELLTAAYDRMRRNTADAGAGMMAVIGLGLTEVSEIITSPECGSLCRINSLNQLCHVLCGRHNHLDRAEALCRRADAIDVVRFDVALPYHHPALALPAMAEFTAVIETLAWQPARIPLISTIDQQTLISIAALKHFVADHLHQPIDWYATTRAMHASQAAFIIECGPGIALTQNARFVAGGNGRWINSKNMEARLGL